MPQGKSTLISAIVDKMKEAKLVNNVARVLGSKVVIGDLVFDVDDAKAWKTLTAEPIELVVSGDKFWNDLQDLIHVGYLHGGYALKVFYEPEFKKEWISITSLSYGERRALAMLLAINMADLVILEGFEGGLHFDLAIELLDKIEQIW